MSTTTAWTLVGTLALATLLLKSAGPLMTGGRALPPRVVLVIAAMPTALLAALVVTSTLTDGHGTPAAGADAVGVLVGGAAVWRTGNVLLAVVLAPVATALLRLL